MSETQSTPRRPVVLIIMDGFGINPSPINNGVAIANTPRLDEIFSNYPTTLLQASGTAVGLPDGQMGNSEVGHLAIGSGEIVRQDLVTIDGSINDGSFFDNQTLNEAASKGSHSDRAVHLIGLVSDGGVHSHIRHIMAVIEICRRHHARPMMHMITDGRDTAPKIAHTYLPELESALAHAGGRIASISGRYYAMDRDNRWDRTESVWQALVNLNAENADSAEQAIHNAYGKGIGDEFIPVTLLPGAEFIGDGSAVIFCNFRKDRARQLTAALTKLEFTDFDRGRFRPIKVTCMTEYDEWFDLPSAFPQARPITTLAEVVSKTGLKQFHCAETEKYAHVTYFLNGRRGSTFQGEERNLVASPQVSTYDKEPAMSAEAVSNQVIDAIQGKRYSLIVVNFANCDMLGHTGIQEAIIKSIETLDQQVGRVLDRAIANEYSVVLTADHGNCELMVDFISGEPHTQHTVFPVPCSIIDKVHWQLSVGAGLTSIAPTILQLMGITIPEGMTGRSLLLQPIH